MVNNFDFPLCQHLKSNGAPCNAPAVRGHEFCYFHGRAREEAFAGLPLEDINSIQLALMRVFAQIMDGSLDPKRAGLLIYALQTAASNVRHLRADPSSQIQAREFWSQVAARASAEKRARRGRPPRKKPAQHVNLPAVAAESKI